MGNVFFDFSSSNIGSQPNPCLEFPLGGTTVPWITNSGGMKKDYYQTGTFPVKSIGSLSSRASANVQIATHE